MKKKLIVLQEENSDCGVCCLLSIIRYYGGNVPLEQLRISSLTTKDGVTAYNLLECAKQYGIQGKGLKIKKLENKNLPLIAHLNINQSLTHFVVIYKITKDYLYIMDPSYGYKKISIKEFERDFTNIILIFNSINQVPNIKEEKILDKKIQMYLKDNTIFLSKIVLIDITFLILSLISSMYISFIGNNLILVLIIFIILNSITLIIRYFSELLEEKLYYQTSNKILGEFYKKILSFPLKYIQLKGTGEIINRVEDLDIVLRIAITSKIKLILYLIIIIPLIIIIGILVKEIIIILLPFILINIFVYKKYASKLNNVIDENIYYNNNYNNKLVSYINGITSIKHTNSSDYILKKIIDSKGESNRSNYLLFKMISQFNLITNISIVTTEIIINIILFLNIKNNNISLELMFIVNILINLLIPSVLDLLKQLPNIYYKKRITSKIDEMLNIEDGGKKEGKYCSGNIKIKNLNYSHNNLTQTLKNLTLKINKGDKVMIKGKNGCGKSTLLKILIKDYENYQGIIYIGKKDIKEIDEIELKNNISYISQEEKLFIGTIRENILMGLDVDLKEIIKICCLEDLLAKKSYGLDTFLHGGGEELSGGEKQLIILARHLVRFKDILIIDEGTSEINSVLEDKILKNIMNYYRDKTFIFVSHKNKERLFTKIIKLY